MMTNILLEQINVLPPGYGVHIPTPRVTNEIETFTLYKETGGQTIVRKCEFTWTPFAIVRWVKTGLFRAEPIRTFDYDAIDRRRLEVVEEGIREIERFQAA